MPSDASTSSPGNAGAPRGQFADPRTLMRIKNLQWRARIVVEGFLSGLHRSPYHGFSAEFSEYRQYSPSDDLRHLDWRLFARTDRYYIKRFQDETNLRCYLLVDLSKSMGYGSLEYTKVEYARTLAATMAQFLSAQRDAVGLVTFDQKIVDHLPARYRPGHLHRLMVGLERAVSGNGTDLALPLEQFVALVRKRGLVIVISDLLADTDMLQERLGYLRSQGHEVVVMRILDPSEIDFPFDKATMFEDLETGRSIYVDAAAARTTYKANFNQHAESIRKACDELGVDLYQFSTARPLELALFDFLQARVRHGRSRARGSRRTGTAGGAR